MTRNTVDFYNGQGFHFAPKKHRDSIEKTGLFPTPKGTHVHEEGDVPRGVYVYNDDESLNHVSGRGSGYPNHDIYQVHIPVQHLFEDPWLPDDASYSESAVPPHLITRVGHVPAEGELHWHKEEDCNGR